MRLRTERAKLITVGTLRLTYLSKESGPTEISGVSVSDFARLCDTFRAYRQARLGKRPKPARRLPLDVTARTIRHGRKGSVVTRTHRQTLHPWRLTEIELCDTIQVTTSS